jgi:hypothetical protein
VVAAALIIWTVGDGKEGTSPDVIVTVFSSALTPEECAARIADRLRDGGPGGALARISGSAQGQP